MFIPHKTCERCRRRQWVVDSSWRKKITRNKNETDQSLKKRQKKNDKILDKAVCQFCSNHGERFNVSSEQLQGMF